MRKITKRCGKLYKMKIKANDKPIYFFTFIYDEVNGKYMVLNKHMIYCSFDKSYSIAPGDFYLGDLRGFEEVPKKSKFYKKYVELCRK